MLELKNISHLRLQVDVPEDLSATLNSKDSVAFTTSAMPGVILKAKISRKSMDISSQQRTERIEADINNKDFQLSPGMYADVMLQSGGNATAFAVPKTAVLTTTEGRYVFVDTGNNTYRKVNVSTGNQTADKVEVYGKLQQDERVVTNPDDVLADEAE